jgi:hypothetical protein
MRRLSAQLKNDIALAAALEWDREGRVIEHLDDYLIEELGLRGIDYTEISRSARVGMKQAMRRMAKRW